MTLFERNEARRVMASKIYESMLVAHRAGDKELVSQFLVLLDNSELEIELEPAKPMTLNYRGLARRGDAEERILIRNERATMDY
jgi:hypothetical protein